MKKSIIASLIIIAALAAYILFQGRDRSDIPELPEWEGPSDEIIINRPVSAITLVRKDGKWLINKEAYPADGALVEGLEKTMRELSIADLVSERGMLSTYDLVPGKQTEVIVRGGGSVLRHVFFGKKSSASQHIFIRLGEGKDVYMARGTFDSLLDESAESLRDREILKLKSGDITGLSITCKGRTLRFELAAAKAEKGKEKDKPAKQWVAAGPDAVVLDTQRMNSLLKLFSPLTATGFSDTVKDSLRNPVASAVVKTSKKEIILNIYEKDKEFLAISSESPYVFTVSEWTAKKFMVENVDNFKAGQ